MIIPRCIKDYIVMIMLSLGFIHHTFADTIYVKEGGTGDGSSWAAAYGNPQSALNVALSGDQIWVAAGTYKPTSAYDLNLSGDRDFHYQMKNNVEIYGGFPATGSPVWADRDPNTFQTILSGDIGIPGNSGDNCCHIFYHPMEIELDMTAGLDGFTITGGNADDDWPHNSGGGMFNEYCSPTVVNCIFAGNTALYGGGMGNYVSHPTVKDCTFSNNSAIGDELNMSFGGGMSNEYCNSVVSGCTFSGNLADYGGGMDNYFSNPLVNNCIFTDNSAVHGGAMDNLSSSPFVTDCTFSNNTASGDPNSAGGGMSNFLEDGSSLISNPTVTHCVFSENSAVYGGGMENEYRNPTMMDCTFTNNTADDGGGMYNFFSSADVRECSFNGNIAPYGGGISNEDSNSLVVNCIFSGNVADWGAGMENYSNSNSTVINCTFSANTADFGGGMENYMSNPSLSNSIFWGNSAISEGDNIYNDTTEPASTPVIAYSDIQGGLPIGSIDSGGNIDADPMFVRMPDDGGDEWGNINDDYGDLRLQGGSSCIDAANGDVASNTDFLGNPRFDDPGISNTGVGIPDYVDMGAYESDDPCLGREKVDSDCNGIVNMADFVYFASRWLQ